MIETPNETRHLTPRSYQSVGIDYMTTPRVRFNPQDFMPTCSRSLNTDPPGAGKTLQASESAQLLATPTQSIAVIAPAHLCRQWYKFWGEQYPSDNVVWLSGARAIKEKEARVNARVYIFSTQSCRRQADFDFYKDLFKLHKINVTIIDESHYVKNGDSKQSYYIRLLTQPIFCQHVILLSATPVIREANDLWHQLRIIDPYEFKSQDTYLNKYCWFTYTSFGPQNITFRTGAIQALSAQVKPNEQTSTNKPVYDLNTGYILGRTYPEIGLELPPIVESDPIIHDMPKDRRKAYDDLKTYWAHKLADGEQMSIDNAMELMHMLRRLTNSPEKIQTIHDYLSDDPGPYVIGCYYKLAAKQIAEDLKLHNPQLNPIVISGDIPANDRVLLAQQAKAPNDVVIATIPSLAEGCDLSHCNTVYFYEEDYTPGRMYQFLSRVRRHRDNSDMSISIEEHADGTNHLNITPDPNDRPVILRYFHADHSIDQQIHAVQAKRAVSVKDLLKVELATR